MYTNGIMLKPALASRLARSMELPNQPAAPTPPGMETTPPMTVEPEFEMNQPAAPAPPGVETTPHMTVTPAPETVWPMPGYCSVRFLFASVDTPPVNITFGNTPIVNGLSFGQITAYTMETSGFRTITVRNAAYPYSILNQSAFRFRQGRLYTVALLTSPGGLVLYLIEDTDCSKSIYQSCMRAVNLSYDVPNVDFRLSDGRIVFSNVSYAAITDYRQFMPGSYTFVAYDRSQCPMPITTANQNRLVQIIPVIIGGTNTNCAGTALVSGTFTFSANMVYTLYLIGSAYNTPALRFLLAESI